MRSLETRIQDRSRIRSRYRDRTDGRARPPHSRPRTAGPGTGSMIVVSEGRGSSAALRRSGVAVTELPHSPQNSAPSGSSLPHTRQSVSAGASPRVPSTVPIERGQRHPARMRCHRVLSWASSARSPSTACQTRSASCAVGSLGAKTARSATEAKTSGLTPPTIRATSLRLAERGGR